MTPETVDNLFERFQQADGSISRRFGGSGLGLYISLNLAELMGGVIDVSSKEGVGSIFQLRIPYRPTALPVEERTQQGERHSILRQQFSGQVLIAEDTPELQILERRILESMGATVTLANNGVEAVELASNHPFDLILMDMQMPEMDGLEATRTLKAAGNPTPIVALTANVMQKHRDAFDQVGGDGFLSKPIDKAELQRTLQRHLLLQQDPQQLQLQGIADRRKAERRSEEVAIIEDERTPKGPRRLSDRVRQATSAAIVNGPVDEAVDDEVTTLFLESSSKNRDRLTIALREREWEEIEAIAHSIKGSATSFGYPDLSTLAESLQNTIAQGEHRQATAEALDLVLALSRILP
jgi:CheY-like chemotaxis protein